MRDAGRDVRPRPPCPRSSATPGCSWIHAIRGGGRGRRRAGACATTRCTRALRGIRAAAGGVLHLGALRRRDGRRYRLGDGLTATHARALRLVASTHCDEHDRTRTAPQPRGDRHARVVSVVIPCLNEAENIEECVTRARGRARGARDRRRGARRRQRLDRRQRRSSRPPAGARVIHEERRGYGSAYLAGFANARGEYIVMLDADLTYPFEVIPQFVEELRRRRRARHGRPDGQHPARARCRGCTATSATRSCPASSTSSSAPACAMRTAACAACAATSCRSSTCARPGMEFASEMVIRASKEKLRIARVPDHVPPAWRRVEAVELPRRLAPPALPARPQPDASVPVARRSCSPRSACSSWRRCSSGLDIVGRPLYLHSMIAGSLLLDRRDAGHVARVLRPRVRHVLHGRPRPVVRPHAQRASGSSTGSCSAARSSSSASSCRAVVFAIWADRGFGGAVRGEPGRPGRDAAHRRHPGLLLVVPAQHPGPAPPRARRPLAALSATAPPRRAIVRRDVASQVTSNGRTLRYGPAVDGTFDRARDMARVISGNRFKVGLFAPNVWGGLAQTLAPGALGRLLGQQRPPRAGGRGGRTRLPPPARATGSASTATRRPTPGRSRRSPGPRACSRRPSASRSSRPSTPRS